MSGETVCGDHLHKVYPKQFQRDQFWHQIKRTVGGKPVSETDIRLIVDQIVTHLDLQPHNHLLDLGCGNGALAARFFQRTQAYTGIDFSRYLLDVAEEYFLPNDTVTYVESDIRHIDNFASVARNADKVLIYGCIAYLTKQDTSTLLGKLKHSLPHLERIFIGNIPNKLRAKEFFAARSIVDCQLDRPDTPIGVWLEPNELVRMANDTGFDAECLQMPEPFFAAKYRFDAILRVRPGLQNGCRETSSSS